MSLNQAPIDVVIEALQTGRVYTKDLSTQQQTELYDTMQHELDTAMTYGTGELGGIATRAFLLSMQRAIKYGVRTMGRNERSPIGIVDYDDCVQEYFVQVSTDWHIGLRNKERRASTLVMHRARAVAQRVIRAHGHTGFDLPVNLNADGIMAAYEDILARGTAPKDHKDYLAILVNSQVTMSYLKSPNPTRLVKDIVRAKDLEPLRIEHITDDDEWEYRCNVDSDTCDDEWVGYSNEPAVVSDLHAYDYVSKTGDLPWYLLSDRQKIIVEKYFGLAGAASMNVQDIANEFGCSQQNVQLDIKKSLGLLRTNLPRVVHTQECLNATNKTVQTPVEIDVSGAVRAYFLANYLRMDDEEFINTTLRLLPISNWSGKKFEKMAKQGQFPPTTQIKNRFGGIKQFIVASMSLQYKAS